MKFNVLTLFPEMFKAVFEHSIIKRAVEDEVIDINLIDIRDYTKDKHNQADDYPYGGGSGIVLKPEPIFRAINGLDNQESPRIFMTPQGQRFDQSQAKLLAEESEITLLCGHYEGVDQRVRDELITKELSIGDYVLTGGELPAMIVIDAVSRLVPGVVGSKASVVNDSFYQGLLDYPQYTRPQEYKGHKAPKVLLSGNHQKIADWREKKALKLTLKRRPDLLEKKELNAKQKKLLNEIDKD